MDQCKWCHEEKKSNHIYFPLGADKERFCNACFFVKFVEIYEALEIDWATVLEEELN